MPSTFSDQEQRDKEHQEYLGRLYAKCEHCIHKRTPHDKWCYMFPDAPKQFCSQFRVK
jgi:hypothetical protein